jgi:hypothetical protein
VSSNKLLPPPTALKIAVEHLTKFSNCEFEAKEESFALEADIFQGAIDAKE